MFLTSFRLPFHFCGATPHNLKGSGRNLGSCHGDPLLVTIEVVSGNIGIMEKKTEATI